MASPSPDGFDPRVNMAAAISCASLVPTAAQADVADQLHRLLHGEYLEAASMALQADPHALPSLLDTAAAEATQPEARIYLLLCLAALNGSSSPLAPDMAARALNMCLSILSEQLASIELQAATRRLLGTMRSERRKAA